MATIDDFALLDIRIGTVLSAEVVPDTDRLIRLMVSFGDHEQQIVSGIQSRVDDPSDLIDKQFPFIINLEPRMIRGFESQGMILIPDEGGFLIPSDPVSSGARVQ